MSESPDQSDQKLERSFLSWLMLIFGIVGFIAAGLAFLSGDFGVIVGFACIGAAGVFFVLSRVLDYLQEIVYHLKQSNKVDKI